MAAVLAAHLAAASRAPPANCAAFAAAWVERMTGHNPAIGRSDRRPLLRQATQAMRAYPRTAAPIAGDVAIVRAPCADGERHVAAICVAPGRFAILADIGLIVAPLPCVAAWRVI